jgi:hypothetical protein
MFDSILYDTVGVYLLTRSRKVYMIYSEEELRQKEIICKKCGSTSWKHLKGNHKMDQSVYCMGCKNERHLTIDEFYHGGMTVD